MPIREKYTALAKLRGVMWDMEVDLGLTNLSQNERDVLYAFHALTSKSKECVTSEEVRSEQHIKGMAHATFHRCLTKLLALGYIERAPKTKSKLYRVCYIGVST